MTENAELADVVVDEALLPDVTTVVEDGGGDDVGAALEASPEVGAGDCLVSDVMVMAGGLWGLPDDSEALFGC